MKKIIIFLFLVLANILVYSQKDSATYDSEAKVILDKLSKNTASFASVRIYFSYSTINKIDSSEENFEGYLYIKGADKYKFIVPNNEVFSDGKKTWSYLKKEGEMTVTWVDPNDKSVLTPSNLLTIYEKGFKYRLNGEIDTKIKQKSGKTTVEVPKTLYVIDLYPEKVKDTPYSIIRIWIDKSEMKITNIRYFGKDEYDYMIDILEFNTETVVPDILFNFNEKNYPADLEIIDATQ